MYVTGWAMTAEGAGESELIFGQRGKERIAARCDRIPLYRNPLTLTRSQGRLEWGSQVSDGQNHGTNRDVAGKGRWPRSYSAVAPMAGPLFTLATTGG